MRLGALLRRPGEPCAEGFNIVLSLEPGEFLRLEAGEDVQVRCDSGRLWITREEDPADVWLQRGESARVDPRGLTLIEAVGLTKLSIARAAA